MASLESWVQVVGYQHEVLHTGVLAAMLNSDDGPSIAAHLTQKDPSSVVDVGNVETEAELPGARGKADLTARLQLAGGKTVNLAVETKVHSNGSCEQLERTTENTDNSEGVFLALGLTSLKMSPHHVARVDSARWNWVGPTDWLKALKAVPDQGRPWLSHYKSALGSWRNELTCDQERDLGHLEWMNAVCAQLSNPARWTEIQSLQSGPVFSRSDWIVTPSQYVYIEFAGLHNTQRVLRLKVGGPSTSDVERLAECIRRDLHLLPPFSAGGGSGRGKRRTVAVTGDFKEDADGAALAAASAVEFLDERFQRTDQAGDAPT